MFPVYLGGFSASRQNSSSSGLLSSAAHAEAAAAAAAAAAARLCVIPAFKHQGKTLAFDSIYSAAQNTRPCAARKA